MVAGTVVPATTTISKAENAAIDAKRQKMDVITMESLNTCRKNQWKFHNIRLIWIIGLKRKEQPKSLKE